jgi:hypothetical protein
MSRPSHTDHDAQSLEFLGVLGLGLPVTVDDVKQAYLEKAKSAHPDHGGDTRQFVRLQEAFEKATEYAKFKAGRMQWLSRWVEQYAEQQQIVDKIRALGGDVNVESVDWLAQSIGADFATVQERVVAIHLEGAGVDDGILLQMGIERRILAGLQRLELVNTKVTSFGLRQLYDCHSLQHLDLSGTSVSLQAVQSLIEKLQQLESIVLRNHRIGWWSQVNLRFRHRGLAIAT